MSIRIPTRGGWLAAAVLALIACGEMRAADRLVLHSIRAGRCSSRTTLETLYGEW
jgi:hypothetical protein